VNAFSVNQDQSRNPTRSALRALSNVARRSVLLGLSSDNTWLGVADKAIKRLSIARNRAAVERARDRGTFALLAGYRSGRGACHFHCIAGKGRDHRVAIRDEVCARPLTDGRFGG